jgi:hypothetical protein
MRRQQRGRSGAIFRPIASVAGEVQLGLRLGLASVGGGAADALIEAPVLIPLCGRHSRVGPLQGKPVVTHPHPAPHPAPKRNPGVPGGEGPLLQLSWQRDGQGHIWGYSGRLRRRLGLPRLLLGWAIDGLRWGQPQLIGRPPPPPRAPFPILPPVLPLAASPGVGRERGAVGPSDLRVPPLPP